MCILCTPRPIYRSTYQPTLDQCISQHIGRVDRYLGRHIDQHLGRHIDQLSADKTTKIC